MDSQNLYDVSNKEEAIKKEKKPKYYEIKDKYLFYFMS